MIEDTHRPLSVLQVVTCRGWSSDAWAAVALCLGLQNAGHSVLMVCREVDGGRNVAERALREGVREVDFIEASGSFQPLSYLRDLRKLRRLAAERDADVIHVHRGVEHWLSAASWPLGGGPALVRSRHIFRPVRRHGFNRWLYRIGTNRVVAVCEKIRQQYLEDGFLPAAGCETVMGGADASRYDPKGDGAAFRRKWGIPEGAWVAGMAGSLRFWMKGQDVLLRAVAEMKSGPGEPPWAVLAGDGEDRAALESLAGELGVRERTVFPGYVEELGEVFSACDALCFPSKRSEGTSRVLFEYLASGRPVVASRVGCVDEIVREGREGFLTASDDAAGLAAALTRL
ncbi:MAG: glycosyltransferase, partial [bacterium]|nr:glycosyltransferase [bacterium]